MPNYFNMHEIGRIIARHRKAHNMTQMELADRMNVSFQAVSNWERGQSMPDIAKLPELAECFGVSIDELLGRNAPLLTSAAEGTLDSYLTEHDVHISEIAEAAPLLKPTQMETLEEKLLELPDAPANAGSGQPTIGELLPFLSTDAVDQLIQRYLDAEDDAALTACLPFASTAKLESIADAWDAQGKPIQPLLPFLSTEKLEQFADAWDAQGKSLQPLFPFMSTAKFDSLADAWDAQGKPIQPLLPFLSTVAVDQLMQRYLDAGDDAALTACLPFASTAKLESIADAWDAQGKPIQPLLPFLSAAKLEQFACDWLRRGKSINVLLPFLDGGLLTRLYVQALNEK